MNTLQLNLGCGHIRPEGWINTDSSLNALVQKFPLGPWISRKLKSRTYESNNVTYMNLNKRWKYKSDSVDTVYASHLFEHLTQENAIKFLSEAFRTLKPGGSMRLVMPDLYLHAKEYVNTYSHNDSKPAENFMWALNLHKGGQYPPNRPVHNFLGALQGFPHQHKFMYDQATLKKLVESVGFNNIVYLEYGQSKYINNIIQVEFDRKLSYGNSLYLEAQK